MHFPRYWASEAMKADGPKRKDVWVSCWAWSDRSEDDARQQARDKAGRIAQQVAFGEPFPQDRYGYGDGRPLREEVIRQIAGSASEPEALITRNSYGCLVLNCSRVMFVDIDLANNAADPRQAAPASGGLISRLFGRKQESAIPPGPQSDPAIDAVEQWARRNGRYGFRVYRTAAGLRLIETTDTHDPASAETASILQGLGSDPLFTKLCRTQRSFRARLTPKPWRIGHHQPGISWPFPTQHQVAAFRKWTAEYDLRAADYATCKYVTTVGQRDTHRATADIIDMHDSDTKAATDLPLA